MIRRATKFHALSAMGRAGVALDPEPKIALAVRRVNWPFKQWQHGTTPMHLHAGVVKKLLKGSLRQRMENRAKVRGRWKLAK